MLDETELVSAPAPGGTSTSKDLAGLLSPSAPRTLVPISRTGVTPVVLCLSSNCPFAVETTPKKLEYCSSKTHHKVNSYCSHVAMRFSGIRH